MKHELDTLSNTVVHNVVDAQWLSEMRRLIDTTDLSVRRQSGDGTPSGSDCDADRQPVNKGVIWEKVWSHPLILSACRYIFNGDFKVSALMRVEALYNGGHQPLQRRLEKAAPDFPKVHR